MAGDNTDSEVLDGGEAGESENEGKPREAGLNGEAGLNDLGDGASAGDPGAGAD